MPAARPIRVARGVRDLLPAERRAWAGVERAAHRTARAFGYQEIETPVIEPIELIERGVGGDTDVVRKEIYRLQAYGRGPAQLALRPEATAGVVRAYFEGGLNRQAEAARLYLLGPMFRHDRPQAGRYRQFYQFDVEAIGDGAAAFDAEVIEMTWCWLTGLQLTGVRLELNSIGDAVCRPAYLDELKAYYRPRLARLHGDCQRRLEVNPLRLLDCKEPQCQSLKEGAPRIIDHLCSACAAHFSELRELLEAAGILYRLNPYLVRGLDYYTRTVFEYLHEALGGAQNALGGGGRYDGLAKALGYPDTPGVGFAGGLDRVVMMVAQEGKAETSKAPVDLLVLPDGEHLSAAAAEVARLVRKVTAASPDFTQRSLRAKMGSAGKSGVRWVAILDAEDARRRVVRLRDMVSGEQREIPWTALPQALGG